MRICERNFCGSSNGQVWSRGRNFSTTCGQLAKRNWPKVIRPMLSARGSATAPGSPRSTICKSRTITLEGPQKAQQKAQQLGSRKRSSFSRQSADRPRSRSRDRRLADVARRGQGRHPGHGQSGLMNRGQAVEESAEGPHGYSRFRNRRGGAAAGDTHLVSLWRLKRIGWLLVR